MEGDTAHGIEEFQNFPWHKMDDKWFSSCGGIGRGGIIGGIDFNRPTYRSHISFVAEDMTCDCWEIPDELARLIDATFRRGEQQRASEIRSLLEYRGL